MSKITEAREILVAFGLPPAQTNQMSSITLLALAGLGPKNAWRSASAHNLRVHDIIIFSKKAYGKKYAENTRETFRRHVLHQFEQAGIAVKNQDAPDLPTNSPKTRYALAAGVIGILKRHGTPGWGPYLKRFTGSRKTLMETYGRVKRTGAISVVLPSGLALALSPGAHNELQARIIKEFAPRFAPEAQVAYVGDTSNKTLYLQKEVLEGIGIPVSQHDKLPDVILYDTTKRRVFLIEAVTTHGPVSHKRQLEFEAMLSRCTEAITYVSAFKSFKEFKKHAQDIAWETEVWLSEMPDHMIHFNGDKFLRLT